MILKISVQKLVW